MEDVAHLADEVVGAFDVGVRGKEFLEEVDEFGDGGAAGAGGDEGEVGGEVPGGAVAEVGPGSWIRDVR